MATLLLRCQGPMQSWGLQSRFRVRDTGREPSKSGIVGLLCAALGRPRHEPVADLARLRMGVRVDHEGRLLRDFHTAGKEGFLKATGSVERRNLITSTRYYLADAAFLVGLEGEPSLMDDLHNALRRPRWPLYLGRKAFVPGLPVWLPDGLQEAGLEVALAAYPWLGWQRQEYEKLDRLRLVRDDPEGPEVRPDLPISFAQRIFVNRRVRTQFIERPPFRQPEAVKEDA